MDKYEIIRNIFKDPKNSAGFSGLENVHKKAKQINKNINKNDVKKALESVDAYTLHRPARYTRYKRLKTLATAINSDWQADLAEFGNIASKENQMNKYLLVIVDIFSRKIYAEPIKNKGSQNVVNAFKEIMERARASPSTLLTDRGTEFRSQAFKKLCEENNIFQKFTYSDDIHAGMVERANRTIKNRLYKLMTNLNNKNWVKYIQNIVDGINNSVNRSIGLTPNQITHENSDEIYNKFYNLKNIKTIRPQFSVGDFVRMASNKGKFPKGYLANYTNEIFKIEEVKEGNPSYYKLKDLEGIIILGKFYNENLVKVAGPENKIGKIQKIEKRGREKVYKIRWLDENNEEILKPEEIKLL